MAGILSSLGQILRYASNVAEEGVAKGTLTTLEDKKIKLLRADGSMLKLLGDYIVEPIAVVSSDLKDVEELDSILGLHMDLFTGYYLQVFEILRNQYNLSISVIVDTLATDNGGLSRLVTKGLSAGIELSSESDDMQDYLSELLSKADLVVNDNGTLSTEDEPPVSETARTNEKLNAELLFRATKRKALSGVDRDKSMSTQTGKHDADLTNEAYRREQLKGVKPEDRAAYINRDIETAPAKLSEAHADLLVPNAIQRTIEIATEVTLEEPGTDGAYHTKTIIIPVVVKLAVIFTSTDNIINAIETKGDEYSFSERLDEYRAGAISLADFVLAGDLVNKYKHNKLKDKDTLLSIMQSRELSANTKMITNNFAGFEKYYNMYIISPEAKVTIEKHIRAKLVSPKGKDRFLERSNGLSVTVMDPDYERIQIMLKDIRGKTDLSFRNAVKKDKNGSDYGEIIKALMASKPPAF